MCHKDQLAGIVALQRRTDGGAEAGGEAAEGLRAEREIGGMLEVRLELAGTTLWQILPHDPGPDPAELPFGEPVVAHHDDVVVLRNRLCGLHGPLQGRVDDRADVAVRQVPPGRPRLSPAGLAQAVAVEVCVDHVIGVVDFAMPDEMDGARHTPQAYDRADGYLCPMAEAFAEPILHVDMDAFFVEVERLHDATLVGRPVVVGGSGARGVVAAASYEARAYGVRSAMPMVEARRRCPNATIVAPNHRRYGDASSQVFEVLRSFTPLVEGLSVDEAFLDVAGLRLHYESPMQIAQAIRDRIRRRLGLPASVGIAPNKFLAKLASEEAKPDGVFHVVAGHELDFLHPLSVRRLWGVGEATYAALEALGVRTVGELAAVPETMVVQRVGGAVGHHLMELANGRDPRSVQVGGGAKSISAESTYERDLVAVEDIERALLRHCDRLSGRLRRQGFAGRTITLKLRFGDFTTLTRSATVPVALEHTADLWDVVKGLLSKIALSSRGVRLLGVGASGLVAGSAPRQMSMEHPERDAAAEAAEQVRARFGDDAVVPARLVDSPSATGADGVSDAGRDQEAT